MAQFSYKQAAKFANPLVIGAIADDPKKLASVLTKMRKLTENRKRQFSKLKSEVYSRPLETISEVKYRDTSKMSRFAMIHEIMQHGSFHASEASTVKGARKVNAQTLVTIFGPKLDKYGEPELDRYGNIKPEKTMNQEQLKQFWKVYREFNHQHKTARMEYESENIIRELGLVASEQGFEVTFEDINELEERLKKYKKVGDFNANILFK